MCNYSGTSCISSSSPERSLSVRCKLYFNNFLIKMNCCGSMVFDHNNETLSISVRLFICDFVRNSVAIFTSYWSNAIVLMSWTCYRCYLFFLIHGGKHYIEIKQWNTCSGKGEASGPGGGRRERHAVAVRRRALLLHRVLHALAVGDHRVALQMPRWVRRLHGEQRISEARCDLARLHNLYETYTICIKLTQFVWSCVSVADFVSSDSVWFTPSFWCCRICIIAGSVWISSWSCRSGSTSDSLSSSLLSPPGDALINVCLCLHAFTSLFYMWKLKSAIISVKV